MTIAVPKFLSDENAIRRMLMVVLALVMTHLISYQKLPFSQGYQFPIIAFSIFVVYGIFICEVNTWNYRRLAAHNHHAFNLKNISRLLHTNLLACAIIFTLLTFAQMLVFQNLMNPFRFVGLLSICLMISAIETGVFVVLGLSKQKSRNPITLNKVAAEKKELTILRNDELIAFKEEDVAYLINMDGCIFLIDQKGHRFTTQFESLSEVEPRLSSRFFRANRRMLVSRNAVRSVKKDVNNKLALEVSHLHEPLTVSRYKSKDLKDWYKS
ncbi:MAG: LytTR family transcriptional regulator DNA-binding domain-containing protein [Cyclobacteriaceae bacterium]|nr:LytTR family transcriptional regulator DNA-binding domain-containing protein [Cyclobacteriaceae bacterium]